jgi:CheY-like chemotaxis protein
MKEIKNIGIVDDDPITVFGIKKMLNSTIDNVQVESYANGKIAIDALLQKTEENQQLPEILFLDINMPIMDGWQFLEEFIKLPTKEKIRINIVTSSIDSIDYEKFKFYKDKTHHLITYNNKPLNKNEIAKITKIAS